MPTHNGLRLDAHGCYHLETGLDYLNAYSESLVTEEGLLNNAFIDYTQNYYPNKRGLDYSPLLSSGSSHLTYSPYLSTFSQEPISVTDNGSGCFGSPSSVGLVNFPSSPASSTRSLMEDIDKFTLEDDAYSYPTSYLWQTSGTIDPSDIERNSGMAASRSPTSTLSTPFSIELQLYSPIINQHATVNSTIEESFFTPPLSTSSKLFSSVVGMAQTATIQERINEDSPPQVLTDARLKRARPNQGQPIPMDCSKHDAFQVPHTGADGYDTAGFRKVVGTQAARDATDKRRQRAPMHFCEVEGCGRSFTSRGNLKNHMNFHRGIIFPCELCSRKLATLSNVRRHLRTAHSEKGVRGRTRQYIRRNGDQSFS